MVDTTEVKINMLDVGLNLLNVYNKVRLTDIDLVSLTAQKVPKYGVVYGACFPVFELNMHFSI